MDGVCVCVCWSLDPDRRIWMSGWPLSCCVAARPQGVGRPASHSWALAAGSSQTGPPDSWSLEAGACCPVPGRQTLVAAPAACRAPDLRLAVAGSCAALRTPARRLAACRLADRACRICHPSTLSSGRSSLAWRLACRCRPSLARGTAALALGDGAVGGAPGRAGMRWRMTV